MNIPTGNDVYEWGKCQGDSSLRINYNLTENSIVVDCGSYHGEWYDIIHKKYNCNILAYEPTFDGYNICKTKSHEKIKIFNYGLYDANVKMLISDDDNGSSVLKSGGTEEIKLIDVGEELKTWGNVDLIKINVEGAEYAILERIIELNAQEKFKNFQIQFHRMHTIPNYEQRRDTIRKVLSKTHHLTYDFTFVWENWELN